MQIQIYPNLHTPVPPGMVIGNSKGDGVSIAEISHAMYEPKLEIPGRSRGQNQKAILVSGGEGGGGYMDIIFWNQVFVLVFTPEPTC